MFNSQVPNPLSDLTTARIARIKSTLRALTESTLEDYQVQVYSSVNGVLNLDGVVQPLKVIAAETPALVGDITSNLELLAEDASDISTVVTSAESIAANLVNLSASSVNQIRQVLRENYYASNASRYLEPFLNDANIASETASLDYSAGQATLTESSSTQIFATSIAAGPNSVPIRPATFTNSTASDGTTLTSVAFNGTVLEIIANFANPVIINRIKIELDNYDGLELSTFTSSPDGTVFQDVLADLGVTNMVLNGISGKLSGDVALDFPPRYISQLRIVFTDRVGTSVINLDSLTFWSRQFAATADLTSVLISAPLGNLQFTSDQDTWGAYTTISHQISPNGVHFTAITPGSIIAQNQPFYYRAQLQRVSSAFQSSSTSVSQDPATSGNYNLTGASTVNIGSNILQRTLNFGSISGPVTIQDSPLPGTFQVFQGSARLPSSSYSYSNNVLSFSAEVYSVDVSYQTSTVGSAAISQLENYYTPVLREVLFEVS